LTQAITLTPLDLSIAALLVVGLGVLGLPLRLKLTRQIFVAALRTTIQLLLVGLVLKWLFGAVNPLWLLLIALVMVLAAAREVVNRQERRFRGAWGFGMGASAMFLSSFAVCIFALTIVIRNQPWYDPRYAIPLLGMLLGNTMNGIAIGLDRLTQTAWQQRAILEARLSLGERWSEAVRQIRRESIRGGMIPIINAMAVAGIVSLPGMMTGQILAGSPPVEAVKYQILIMFLIAAGSGFGTIAAVSAGSRRLFDERERLRLDRLKET
jgi:putative ABC transport system permease protein